MTETAGAVHLIAPLAQPEVALGRMLQVALPGDLILDLSVGHLRNASRLDPEQATAAGIHWRSAADFVDIVAEPSRRRYVEWVARMSDAPLHRGRSIKELFAYRGSVSLWWFTAMSEQHAIYHPYRWLFYMLGAIEGLRREARGASADEWHLWVADLPTGQVLSAAIRPNARAIIHRVEESAEARSRRLAVRLGGAVRKVGWLTVQSCTRLRGRGGCRAPWNARADDARVLIVGPFPDWQVPGGMGESAGRAPTTRHLGDMPSRLEDFGVKVAWMPATHGGQEQSWVTAARVRKIADASPWMTVGVGTWLRIAGHQLRWILSYLLLFRIRGIHKQWRYEDIPLGHWLRQSYRRVCVGSGLRQMLALEQYRSAVTALRPDAVLYTNEFYRTGRVISAAGAGLTKLIGVQHGLVDAEHTVYQFGSGQVRRWGPSDPVDHVHTCPVPDVFAVFGTFMREQFECWDGYPAERVVPIGGVRHDELGEMAAGSAVSTRARRPELGLPTDRRVITLCTGLTRDAGVWFQIVVEGLRLWGQRAFVAVKLHPLHGGESEVEATAERLGFDEYGVFRTSPYPLIAAADLMVGGTSTTLLEGYLLGTPVLHIGSQQREVYPFSEEGIGLQVWDAESMAAALSEALSDAEQYRRRWALERERVLERHLWNSDGAACRRLAALVRARADLQDVSNAGRE